jgi:tetratricopeptide (TPR) repeat protein
LVTGSIAAIALGAIAVWPWFVKNGAQAAHAASLPTAAPVSADYENRDRLIAFWERAQRKGLRGDLLSPEKLSGLYLQRYRERGDIDDVTRAVASAQRSLRAQPYDNVPALVDLASADVALHRFKAALAITRDIEQMRSGDEVMPVREASLDLELGRYGDAHSIVVRLERRPAPADAADAIPADTLLTRYDELTGHLARARERFERTTAIENALYDEGAQQRAWFYFRSGELAFEAGDNDAALADERTALTVFPNYSEANRLLAKFSCALHRWQECLSAAKASANVVPYPEVLGYEVDADRALGFAADAQQTDDLIGTIEKIGNAQHVADRLLAIYYSEHHEHLADAYGIATRELAVRDDVFTEDTLAWAAAMDGRWNEARRRIAIAQREGTQNALLHYHAGIIAEHFGDRAAAARELRAALALNAWFHPFYADDARTQLAAIGSAAAPTH